jgi:hypothetical protein
MIDHDNKVILINISGTASEGIEMLFFGHEYWYVHQGSTWICTTQAKQSYNSAHAGGVDYWDDYFKFSLVRNPYERVIANLNAHKMAQTACRIGFNYYDHIDQLLDYRWYLAEKYTKTYGVVVEPWTTIVWLPYWGNVLQYCNHAQPTIDEILSYNFTSNNIYGNILKEPIDKIYKSENYEEVILELAGKYNLPQERVDNVIANHKPKPYIDLPTNELPKRLQKDDSQFTRLTVADFRPNDIKMINDLYYNDFIEFGYEMINPDDVT